jgi:hypothetical protein
MEKFSGSNRVKGVELRGVAVVVCLARSTGQQMDHHLSEILQQVTLKTFRTDNDIKNHLFSRFRLAVRRINKIA